MCEFSREPIEIANNFLILHKVLVAFHLCFYFFRLGLVVLFRETNPKNMNSVLIIFWFRSSLCLRLRAQCSFFSGYANTENTRRQCTDNTQSTAIIRSVENARARASHHTIKKKKKKKKKRVYARERNSYDFELDQTRFTRDFLLLRFVHSRVEFLFEYNLLSCRQKRISKIFTGATQSCRLIQFGSIESQLKKRRINRISLNRQMIDQ